MSKLNGHPIRSESLKLINQLLVFPLQTDILPSPRPIKSLFAYLLPIPLPNDSNSR